MTDLPLRNVNVRYALDQKKLPLLEILFVRCLPTRFGKLFEMLKSVFKFPSNVKHINKIKRPQKILWALYIVFKFITRYLKIQDIVLFSFCGKKVF